MAWVELGTDSFPGDAGIALDSPKWQNHIIYGNPVVTKFPNNSGHVGSGSNSYVAAKWIFNSIISKQYAQAEITPGGNEFSLLLRLIDNNGYRIIFGYGGIYYYKLINGSDYYLGAGPSYSGTHVCRAEFVDSTCTILIDGSPVGSFEDSSYSSGTVGIAAQGSSTGSYGANWSCGIDATLAEKTIDMSYLIYERKSSDIKWLIEQRIFQEIKWDDRPLENTKIDLSYVIINGRYYYIDWQIFGRTLKDITWKNSRPSDRLSIGWSNKSENYIEVGWDVRRVFLEDPVAFKSLLDWVIGGS